MITLFGTLVHHISGESDMSDAQVSLLIREEVPLLSTMDLNCIKSLLGTYIYTKDIDSNAYAVGIMVLTALNDYDRGNSAK